MSGLVKGVKKVFKAIGTAVKKVMKTTIGKILVGALAIFTGGAALAAFGAMGAGATFGSVMSAGLAGGMAPFSAAFSALSGAASSVGSALGLTSGTAGATTAGVTEGVIGGMGTEVGSIANGTMAGVGEMGVEAGSVAAGTVPEAIGGMGVEAGSVANGVVPDVMSGMGTEAGSVANGVMPQGAVPQGANLVDMAAPTQAPSGGFVANTGTVATQPAAPITDGIASSMGKQATSSGNWLTNLWDFVKPETAAGRLMYGQVLSSVGNSVMQGRAQQAQQDYQSRMTAVPDISKTFEKKPDFRWALAGGK